MANSPKKPSVSWGRMGREQICKLTWALIRAASKEPTHLVFGQSQITGHIDAMHQAPRSCLHRFTTFHHLHGK